MLTLEQPCSLNSRAKRQRGRILRHLQPAIAHPVAAPNGIIEFDKSCRQPKEILRGISDLAAARTRTAQRLPERLVSSTRAPAKPLGRIRLLAEWQHWQPDVSLGGVGDPVRGRTRRVIRVSAVRRAGDLVTLTTRHLKKGDKIRLTGLGILQVRKRAARMGRNPATGEAIKIKASKKIAFRPAKELKEAV